MGYTQAISDSSAATMPFACLPGDAVRTRVRRWVQTDSILIFLIYRSGIIKRRKIIRALLSFLNNREKV